MNRRALAYLLLRISVGVMFFFYGFVKLRTGLGTVASGMVQRFHGKLPEVAVDGFAHLLPFVELALGLLLVLGLFTELAVIAAAVLMIVLIFGSVIEPNPATVSANVGYALVLFILLWTVEHDGYSADARFRRVRRGSEADLKP